MKNSRRYFSRKAPFYSLRNVLVIVIAFALAAVGGFGEDEFMSCDRYFESKREARLLDHIPCDMQAQSYCQHKGSVYPEAAIWRFKEENRALMRRMYGDMESSIVYREMRAANLHNLPSEEHSIFSSLEYNIRMGSGLATVKSAREPVVKFPSEPTTATGLKRKKIVVKKKKKQPSPEQAAAVDDDDVEDGKPQSVVATQAHFRPTVNKEEPLKVSAYSTTTMTTTTTTTTTTTITSLTSNETETTTTTTTTASSSPADDGDPSKTTVTAAEPQADESTTSTTPTASSTTTTLLDDDLNMTVIDLQYDETLAEHQKMSDLPKTMDEYVAEYLSDVDLESLEEIVEGLLDEVDDSATSSGGESGNKMTETPVINAQTLADAAGSAGKNPAHKTEPKIEDEEEFIDYSGPSINACPVKEEVFAPYWANNTRDQVLALLNLYPFEQYIHMETCQFESEQMMCRKGCRCEQQYRLHRLLAFDPSNECRGIFSDWFRFPSYCICKCYNFPEDYLEQTPRNPKAEENLNHINHDNLRQTKESKFPQNIPAILPYEAKQALLRDFNGNPRQSRKNGQEVVEEIVNDVEKDEEEEQQQQDQHFLYGNAPILEYQISDGKRGTIRKTPRK